MTGCAAHNACAHLFSSFETTRRLPGGCVLNAQDDYDSDFQDEAEDDSEDSLIPCFRVRETLPMGTMQGVQRKLLKAPEPQLTRADAMPGGCREERG